MKIDPDRYWELRARRDPDEVRRLLNAGMSPADLTFALVGIGRAWTKEDALPYIRAGLEHKDSIVREGAIYAIEPEWLIDPALYNRVANLAHNDPSPGVRISARNLFHEVLQPHYIEMPLLRSVVTGLWNVIMIILDKIINRGR